MLRDYQQRAIDQLYDWFAKSGRGNPCMVLPTGAGKSHIVAALCKDALTNWPETRILMLTHQKELIEQNAEKLHQHWPRAPLGIYSASLNRRTLGEPITFAGIQSVAKRGRDIGHIDLVIVDEAHTINHAQTGGYRTLLAELLAINPNLRVIGLTATPYRLGHGMIHEGEDVIFSDLIEPVTIEELIGRGYLSMLRSKHTSLTLDTAGVRKQGGDFIASQLEAAVDTADNNLQAVDEICRRAADRKAWLIFAAGVAHAEHLAELLRERGIATACVTGATPQGERAQILRDFKSGKLRAVTNVSVLTTGFDHPGIDCLAMLRPTLSPGLYVQMAGRGLRVADGKTDCLVLDFAGNVTVHGPITCVAPPDKAKAGDGQAPSKTCPRCEEMVAPNTLVCPSCGHEWPKEERETAQHFRLHHDDIMGLAPSELLCTAWQWRRHISRASGREMLSVTYYGGLSDPAVTEYLPVSHEGYAGEKARRLAADIARRSGVVSELPVMLEDAAQMLCTGRAPAIVRYRREGKFYRVEDREWQG